MDGDDDPKPARGIMGGDHLLMALEPGPGIIGNGGFVVAHGGRHDATLTGWPDTSVVAQYGDASAAPRATAFSSGRTGGMVKAWRIDDGTGTGV